MGGYYYVDGNMVDVDDTVLIVDDRSSKSDIIEYRGSPIGLLRVHTWDQNLSSVLIVGKEMTGRETTMVSVNDVKKFIAEKVPEHLHKEAIKNLENCIDRWDYALDPKPPKDQ
ncbi:MAG: hypothetical protein MPK62_02195 [Alphaproteobacteria bacterium]|nr:hypothetical protein [Alphaproteobacteria bacterium]MDA8029945.1 hypothetical protein [Alphaproteobacteria bacterium]